MQEAGLPVFRNNCGIGAGWDTEREWGKIANLKQVVRTLSFRVFNLVWSVYYEWKL